MGIGEKLRSARRRLGRPRDLGPSLAIPHCWLVTVTIDAGDLERVRECMDGLLVQATPGRLQTPYRAPCTIGGQLTWIIAAPPEREARVALEIEAVNAELAERVAARAFTRIGVLVFDVQAMRF